MKKYFLTFMCMAFLGLSLSAQKLPKSVKDAKKALNAGSFDNALQLINTALEDDATANIAEAWAVKGDVLGGMLGEEYKELVKVKTLGNGAYTVKNIAVGPEALSAYETAIKKSADAKDKGMKASIKGLVDLANSLNELGLQMFNNKKYGGAFDAFSSVLGAKKALNAIGNESIFSKEEDFRTMQYYTGLAAAYAKTPEKANDIYENLAKNNFDKPLPYEQLFDQRLAAGDEEGAMAMLEKGKKNCAADPKSLIGFLYKEINFYLKKGEFATLETKLQDAIAQDPENPTLYYALGNVYGELSTGALAEGKTDDSKKYFEEAKKYYNKTMEVKPEHFDAAYNIGALFYNQATLLNDPLKELGSDMTNAGMKKYDDMKEQQKGFLDASVPHFEKALSINPKHLASMEALKGVAAYNNDTAGIAKYDAMIEDLKK